MKHRDYPDMDDIDPARDFAVGQVKASLHPDGSVERASIEGILGFAKDQGLDPESVYKEALENVPEHRSRNAPPYAEVAPK